MRSLRALISRVQSLLFRGRVERELDEELQFHLDRQAEAHAARGLSAGAARRAALRDVGALERWKDASRDVRYLWRLDEIWRDVRFGARRLGRQPGFAAAIIVTLALAIGANAAIFGVADEALFRPLPLPQADQLTAIYSYNKQTAKYDSSGVSYPDFQEYRRRARSFKDIAAYMRYPLDVVAAGVTSELSLEAVSTNYFQTLALAPALGTTFSAPDALEALISETLWRRRFQADPTVLGRAIEIVGQDRRVTPYTVVGVVPARYRGINLNWNDPAEVWIPLETIDRPVPAFREIKFLTRRGGFGAAIFGRRAAGVTVAQSQAELSAIAASLAESGPASNRDMTVMAFEANRSKFWPAYRGQVALSLAVFAVAAALVLLLACANISNLLLERAMARRSEIAIRLAIGASRARLVRQMLVENLLLVLPSVALALLVAYGLGLLVSQFPGALGVSLVLEQTVDSRVLLFGVCLSLFVTCAFGVLSALHASRAGVQPMLKASSYAIATAGAPRLRRMLLVAQLGFAMILLVGCGLFGRSLLAGYSRVVFSDQTVLAWFGMPDNGLPPRFSERLSDESRGLPGVVSSSVAAAAPLWYGSRRIRVAAPDQAPVESASNAVGADFFQTMGIRLLAGRAFTRDDGPGSTGVAVVSRELAARLWPAGSAVGRRVAVQEDKAAPQTLDVIGVAEDTPVSSIWESPTPVLYRAETQSPASLQYRVVRVQGDPAALAPAIRPFWERVAPGVPFFGAQTGREAIDKALAPQRLAANLFMAFGALAVVLMVVGVYSLTAFSVASRTREIGIRIALGARPASLVRQMVAQTLTLGVIGIVLGAAGGLGLGRLAASLIRDVSPYDGATFAGVAALLAAVAILAAWIPARRASRIDPLSAVRSE